MLLGRQRARGFITPLEAVTSQINKWYFKVRGKEYQPWHRSCLDQAD